MDVAVDVPQHLLDNASRAYIYVAVDSMNTGMLVLRTESNYKYQYKSLNLREYVEAETRSILGKLRTPSLKSITVSVTYPPVLLHKETTGGKFGRGYSFLYMAGTDMQRHVYTFGRTGVLKCPIYGLYVSIDDPTDYIIELGEDFNTFYQDSKLCFKTFEEALNYLASSEAVIECGPITG